MVNCWMSTDMLRETAVTDFIIGYVWIESVDSTNITVRARVSTASVTAGSTFKLMVTARV